MRYWSARVLAVLALALLVVAPGALSATPVHATPHAHTAVTVTSFTVAVSDGVYGDSPAASFTFTLKLSAPLPNYLTLVWVTVNSGQPTAQTIQFNGTLPTPDGGTTFSRTFASTMTMSGTYLTPGTYTATPYAADPNGSTTAITGTPSNQFTIGKANVTQSCNASGGTLGASGSIYSVGQTLTVGISYQNQNSNLPPIDWQNATFTFTFAGPSPIAYPNVKLNANMQFQLAAPSQPGTYTLSCTFSGTSSYNTTTSTSGPLTVSLMRPLGSVQVFSHPTTLVSGQPADVEVVFHAGSGCPVPSLYFFIDLIGGGSYYFTKTIPINPGGDTLVHLDPLPNLNGVTNVRVDYPGDTCYAAASVLFPLTNPPIGGTGGSSGGGQAPTATTAPSSTATGAAAAAATVPGQLTPTAQSGNSHAVYAAGTPWYRSGALWWVVLVALLVLGGAGGGAFWWLRRGTPGGLASTPGVGITDTASPPNDAPPPDPAN
jgi:hypothetical protein